jgi:heterodisulfide reductase subunit A-like polyferredoxin
MVRAGKTDPMRISAIGTGMAGLNAAQNLAERGYDVVVVEKSRGAISDSSWHHFALRLPRKA